MTEKTSRDELLDKIGKLQAMAESAKEIGSEAEAQAFAAKVQELLTAYKLSMADVQGHAARVAEEPIDLTYVTWADLDLQRKMSRVGWTEHLAHLVAGAYYCRFVIPGGSVNRSLGSIAIFVGAETDRKVCVYMFITLARFLYDLAEREMHRFWVTNNVNGKLPDDCKGFKSGFIIGFIKRLGERFNEELRPKGDAARTTAIVHVKRDAVARADQWLSDNMKTGKCRMASVDYGNVVGRARGKKCADDVDLDGKAVERTGKANAQIGGGR